MNDFLHNIDWAIAMRSDFLTPVFKVFTWMGYGGFLLALVAVGYWSYDKKIFSRAGLFLLLTTLLNSFLKDFFMDPRPDAVYQLDAAVHKSFGFPSGHAQIAVVVWFWIAWEVQKKWVWVVCSVIVAGICLSRLYLGVHDVEDVLGGLIIGMLCLLMYKYLSGERFSWWQQVHPLYQIGVIALIELFFIVFWPGGTAPDKSIAYSAFLAVFWAGILYERKKIKFTYHASPGRVITAAIVGLIFLLTVRWVFGQLTLFFDNYYLLIKILEAIISGLVITIFAPCLFQNLKLADRDIH